MAKKEKLSDQIRAAIESCGISRYRLALDCNIDAALLCRFMQGQSSISLNSIDVLAERLDWTLNYTVKPISKSKRVKPTKKGGM